MHVSLQDFKKILKAKPIHTIDIVRLFILGWDNGIMEDLDKRKMLINHKYFMAESISSYMYFISKENNFKYHAFVDLRSIRLALRGAMKDLRKVYPQTISVVGQSSSRGNSYLYMVHPEAKTYSYEYYIKNVIKKKRITWSADMIIDWFNDNYPQNTDTLICELKKSINAINNNFIKIQQEYDKQKVIFNSLINVLK